MEKQGPFIDEFGLLWVPIPKIPGYTYPNIGEWEQLGFIYHGKDRALIRPVAKTLNGKTFPAAAWLESARKKYANDYPHLPLGEPVIEPRISDPHKAARRLFNLYNENVWDSLDAYSRSWEYYKYAGALHNAYRITDSEVRRIITRIVAETWEDYARMSYEDLVEAYRQHNLIRIGAAAPAAV